MHFPIVAPGDDLGAKELLCRVHGLDQIGEAARGGCISARDIGCVAAVLRARVDQEGAQGRGRRALQVLVMKHRRVFVVGDDVVVRQLLFPLRACFEVAHVCFVFGASATKCGQCRAVSPSADLVCAAHACEFVGCLDGAIEVKPREQSRRIDAGRIAVTCENLRTDVSHAPEMGPVIACFPGLLRGDQIHLGRPWRIGKRCGFVPVVVRAME